MLANGELAGKIVCPNKKCGTKIGNYDWAGVCCGCKEWVTPVRWNPRPRARVLTTAHNRAFASIAPRSTKSSSRL